RVAIAGDTVVVGATGEDSGATGVNGNQADNSVPGAGAAYVFVRSGTNWSQQAYLKASNPMLSASFGLPVAFSEECQVARVLKASNAQRSASFGGSVALTGNTLVVGAFLESSGSAGVNGDQNNNDAYYSGAAYVFVRKGTNWSQQAYLKSSNPDSGDLFAFSA